MLMTFTGRTHECRTCAVRGRGVAPERATAGEHADHNRRARRAGRHVREDTPGGHLRAARALPARRVEAVPARLAARAARPDADREARPSHRTLALSLTDPLFLSCSLFTVHCSSPRISSAVLDRTRVRVQCYDLRFPELGLWQYGQGAEVISYPAAFVHEPASERWSVCRADYHFSDISTFTAVQNNWFARTRYSKLFPVFVMFFSHSAL